MTRRGPARTPACCWSRCPTARAPGYDRHARPRSRWPPGQCVRIAARRIEPVGGTIARRACTSALRARSESRVADGRRGRSASLSVLRTARPTNSPWRTRSRRRRAARCRRQRAHGLPDEGSSGEVPSNPPTAKIALLSRSADSSSRGQATAAFRAERQRDSCKGECCCSLEKQQRAVAIADHCGSSVASVSRPSRNAPALAVRSSPTAVAAES